MEAPAPSHVRSEMWLNCNDENVEEINRSKRQKKDKGEWESSSNVYMLVYARDEAPASIPPSRAILDLVEADNAALGEQILAYHVK